MTNKPKISVIMSAYNEQEYIAEAIDSILSQTFQDFEFLIVDDGSTDDTPKILAEYAKKDSRIKVITNEKNIGRPKSSNILLSECTSDLIARMDADDWSHPDRLSIQYHFMQEHPDVSICGTNLEYYDEGGNLIYPECNDAIKSMMMFRSAIAHPTTVIRKNEIFKNGVKYSSSFEVAEDYALWLDLIACPEIKFHNVQHILHKYRVFPNKDRQSYLKERNSNTLKKQLEVLKILVPDVSEEELKTHYSFMYFLYFSDVSFLLHDKDLKKIEKWFKKLLKKAETVPWLNSDSLGHYVSHFWQIYFLWLIRNGKYMLGARAFFSSLFWYAPITSDLNIFNRGFKKLILRFKS